MGRASLGGWGLLYGEFFETWVGRPDAGLTLATVPKGHLYHWLLSGWTMVLSHFRRATHLPEHDCQDIWNNVIQHFNVILLSAFTNKEKVAFWPVQLLLCASIPRSSSFLHPPFHVEAGRDELSTFSLCHHFLILSSLVILLVMPSLYTKKKFWLKKAKGIISLANANMLIKIKCNA